jgi:hypothetical protein
MSATFATQKTRGKPFEKGMKKIGGSGRRKGVPNLTTQAVKVMIACAADALGGTARLVEWCKESEINERLFWTTIWPRLLPLQIQGTGAHGELELELKLSAEQLTQQLKDRGLPTMLFGADKPVQELEPRRIEGNGAAPEDSAGGDVDDPAPLLEQICAPDSASDRDRAFLEARMTAHIERYGGST